MTTEQQQWQRAHAVRPYEAPADAGVGVTQTRLAHFTLPAEAPFALALGDHLPSFDLAYET
ncbi:MAG TPA: hypothetical protein VGP33_14000, partial [Chloroflexota bacterium]|nr:hypothetical protein [Chloroflexota bacterium]